ncbi:MAG: helix-turn-helix domain-containing protein [Paludibacteraceae bacterium]|nr:helix-turn-helix domain-containing protein [Paludibacteraceae bacterium]
MAKSTIATNLPRKAEKNLQIVGEQIRLARLRRDLSIARIAERAMCSELTVMRVERGTPTVAIGIYLRILFALGLDESILYIAKDDDMGRTLQDLDLKHRQRASKQ